MLFLCLFSNYFYFNVIKKWKLLLEKIKQEKIIKIILLEKIKQEKKYYLKNKTRKNNKNNIIRKNKTKKYYLKK